MIVIHLPNRPLLITKMLPIFAYSQYILIFLSTTISPPLSVFFPAVAENDLDAPLFGFLSSVGTLLILHNKVYQTFYITIVLKSNISRCPASNTQFRLMQALASVDCDLIMSLVGNSFCKGMISCTIMHLADLQGECSSCGLPAQL